MLPQHPSTLAHGHVQTPTLQPCELSVPTVYILKQNYFSSRLNVLSSRKPYLIGFILWEEEWHRGYSARRFLKSPLRINIWWKKGKKTRLDRRGSIAVMKYQKKPELTPEGVLKLTLKCCPKLGDRVGNLEPRSTRHWVQSTRGRRHNLEWGSSHQSRQYVKGA